MVYKRVRGLTSGRSLPVLNFLNFTDVAKCRVTVTLQNAKVNVQQSNFLIKDIFVNYNLPIKKCQAFKKSVIDLKSNPCRVEVSKQYWLNFHTGISF